MTDDAGAGAGHQRPGDVIDAHTHLFTVGLLEEVLSKQPPEAMQRFRAGAQGAQVRASRAETLPDMTPEECAAWYVGALNDGGRREGARHVGHARQPVDARLPRRRERPRARAVQRRSARPGAPALLEREMAAGFRGVKLLPVNRCYRLSDPACRPFFEKAAELGAPIIIHYGVTVDPTGDLRYADPLDLSPVARDFPELTVRDRALRRRLARQALRLAYQCKNVCVDTCGTNNWMDYYVPKMTLPEVFERALTALGPERVLFGTDSGTTAPYRDVDQVPAGAHARGDRAVRPRPRPDPARQRRAHLPARRVEGRA